MGRRFAPLTQASLTRGLSSILVSLCLASLMKRRANFWCFFKRLVLQAARALPNLHRGGKHDIPEKNMFF